MVPVSKSRGNSENSRFTLCVGTLCGHAASVVGTMVWNRFKTKACDASASKYNIWDEKVALIGSNRPEWFIADSVISYALVFDHGMLSVIGNIIKNITQCDDMMKIFRIFKRFIRTVQAYECPFNSIPPWRIEK